MCARPRAPPPLRATATRGMPGMTTRGRNRNTMSGGWRATSMRRGTAGWSGVAAGMP